MSRTNWSRADWMRAYRQHPGLTVREFAEATGKSVSAVKDAKRSYGLAFVPVQSPYVGLARWVREQQAKDRARRETEHRTAEALLRDGYGWEDLCAKLALSADEARSLARLSPQTRAA